MCKAFDSGQMGGWSGVIDGNVCDGNLLSNRIRFNESTGNGRQRRLDALPLFLISVVNAKRRATRNYIFKISCRRLCVMTAHPRYMVLSRASRLPL